MPGTWRKGGKIRGISRLLSPSDHHRPKDEGGDDGGSGAGPRGPKKPPRWLLPPVPGASGFSTMASLASQIVALPASASASNAPSSPTSWPTPAFSPPDTAAEDAAHQQQREGDDDLESFIEAGILATNILYGLPPCKLPKEEVFNVLLGQKAPSGDVLQSFRVSECDPLKGFDEPTARKGEAFESSSGSDTIKDGPPQPKAPVNEAPESSAVAAEEAEKKVLEAEKKRAFMVVAKVLFFMVILVMSTKKIAISALAALLIEAIGKRLLSSERPCKEEEKSVEVVVGDVVPVSDLAQVPDALDSSSCERIPFELEENSGLDSGSEGASLEEGSPGEEAPGPALETEEWDPVEAKGGQCDQRPPRRKGGKTKRLLRRIVRRWPTASSVESEEMEEKGARAA